MKDKAFKLSDDEKELVERLRDEARDVKDCFTKFSFQALIFASILFGIIVRYQSEYPVVSIAAIAVIFLLQAVERIGTYKYATANRNFGYELHLYRSKYSTKNTSLGWQEYMRAIGWEEAIRAWRVVQATVFSHLYHTDLFIFREILPNKLKRKHSNPQNEKSKYLWFEPNRLVIKGAKYHAGNYLNTMFAIMNFFTFLALLPMAIEIYSLYQKTTIQSKWQFYLALISYIVLLLYIIWRMYKTSVRRKVLESGLLCIHSCSIMWQAVVVAHYRALNAVRKANLPEGVYYKNYTEKLSEQALLLRDNIFDIHLWIHDKLSKKQEKDGN